MVVNWNNRPCLELLLKSYIKHHYNGTPLKLLLWDNESKDDSRDFYLANGIHFQTSGTNIGHENALNQLYPQVNTKYCLLVDSDILFNENCSSYLDLLNGNTVALGDLITNDRLGDSLIKPRLAAWFILFDIEMCRKKGITYFRNNTDWSYDVGSQFYENIIQAGLGVHAIQRLNSNPDGSIIGMNYGKFGHLLRMSWDLGKHADRTEEVARRKRYVLERLKEFESIDLKGKFA